MNISPLRLNISQHGSPQLSFMQTSSAAFHLSPKEYIYLVCWDGGHRGCSLSCLHLDLHGASMLIIPNKNSDPCSWMISQYPSRTFLAIVSLCFFFPSFHKKQPLYYSCDIKYMSFSTNTPCSSSHANHFKCCWQGSPLLRSHHGHSGIQLLNIRAHWYLHTLLGIPRHL